MLCFTISTILCFGLSIQGYASVYVLILLIMMVMVTIMLHHCCVITHRSPYTSRQLSSTSSNSTKTEQSHYGAVDKRGSNEV